MPSWKEHVQAHYGERNNLTRLLWKREVFTAQNITGVEMVAVNGKVFFIGSLYKTGSVELVALQGNSGEVLWQRPTAGGYLTQPRRSYI